MRNKIILIGTIILSTLASTITVRAQQDPMFTQYADNLLVINPAFAGTKEVGNALFVARNQWVEFDGAPTTRSFSYNTSVDTKNVGFGVSVMTDKIGPLRQTGFYVDYSYFLKVSDKFKLGMGLKGGVSFYRANLTELETVEVDPIYQNDIYENFLPNVGIGFFLFSDRSFVGLSVPRLIENEITDDGVETEYVSRQKLHLYLVGGHEFEMNNDLQLKTSGMVKWVKSAPVSVDVSALLGFRQKFWIGAMYRWDVAYGIIAQFKPTPKMSIGYSYDIITSEISGYNNGSHEIVFSYDIDLFNRVRTSYAQLK